MILDLDDIPKKDNVVKEEQSQTGVFPTSDNLTRTDSPSSLQNYPSKDIIMKVLHTRTEITIYPNGQIYHKSQSWFENQTYQVKKKEKPKPAEVKEVSSKKIEEY